MKNFAAQMTAFQQLQVKTATAVSQALSQNMHDLTRINMAMGQKAAQDAIAQAQAWLRVRTPEDAYALMQAQNNHLLGYANELKAALTRARDALVVTVDEHIEDLHEVTDGLFAEVEKAAGPAGSALVASAKNAVATAKAATEKVTEVAQQVQTHVDAAVEQATGVAQQMQTQVQAAVEKASEVVTATTDAVTAAVKSAPRGRKKTD